MTDNGELQVVFGTGAVGMSVMDELVQRGRQARVVNRSGRVSVPEGVEVVGGDATDEAFAREASEGASSSTSPSIRPTTSGPSCFHRCRQECWRAQRPPGRSL
jgi:hypothetical protein